MATVVNRAINMNILPCIMRAKLFKEGLSEAGCRNLGYSGHSVNRDFYRTD